MVSGIIDISFKRFINFTDKCLEEVVTSISELVDCRKNRT